MELSYEDLDNGVRRIRLSGRMDVDGAREIDLKFTTLTATRQAFVIVDLALVDFLSSLGLGTLVRSAKAQMSRQGKFVLLSPQANVAKVLEMTQVDQILPVFYDFELARQAVAPARTSPG
ncbi:MAG TPA: STAS domain-containing protein [Thermoanaerobaculia bacterium]|nr:STAS domain-containing protein [Thermoanaerobaculia bacterium]